MGEATDLLRPLENDIPVLEAIENELDESEGINEAFLAPVESDVSSFSLLPIPIENEFPILEATDYQEKSEMEISGKTDILIPEKDIESTEIYDISIEDDKA